MFCFSFFFFFFFLGGGVIITCDPSPSIYKMDHPDFIVYIFIMETSIGLKMVNV